VSVWKRLLGRGGEPVRPRAFEIGASVVSDPGCVRENNEDNGSFTRPDSPATLASKGVLALVADGMGGAEGGEVASSMAIAAVPRYYYENRAEPHTALAQALQRVNRDIFERAAREPSLAGMGTTAAALALRGSEAFAAYVGDSRIYLLRDACIRQMSEDHTVVSEMVRRGIMSAVEARNHEDRSLLFRSIGTESKVEVSVWQEPLEIRSGDRFLLCSDGLHDLLDDAEILAIAVGGPHGIAARRLVDAAKERGGHDNITVALLEVQARGGRKLSLRPTRQIEMP